MSINDVNTQYPEYVIDFKFEVVKEEKKMAGEFGTMAINHNEEGHIENLINYQDIDFK